MKKINNYSAQFEIIQKPLDSENESQLHNNNPKKKLSKQKQNQEFLNKISASGFNQPFS